MNFEFDPKKSDSNRNKHVIDFIDAQEFWNDVNLLEVPAKTTDEVRFLAIGKIDEKHWTAIVTYHNDNIYVLSQYGVPEMRRLSFMKAKELDKKFGHPSYDLKSSLQFFGKSPCKWEMLKESVKYF